MMHYRFIIFSEHSPAAMFVKDREGRYRFVNPQFLQRLGLRREQAIGRTDAELFPPSAACFARRGRRQELMR